MFNSEDLNQYAFDDSDDDKNEKAFKMLLEQNDINAKDANGNTILLIAIILEKMEIAKKILLEEEDNININFVNKYNQSALILASERPNMIEITKMLLERNDININIKDNYGNTALMNSVIDKNEVITEMLLERDDIDINIKNNDGSTALILSASYYKNNNIFRLLLKQNNIDVNAKNRNGRTALMCFAMRQSKNEGDAESLEILLKRDDIDIINIKDNYEKTFLMHLVRNENNFVSKN